MLLRRGSLRRLIRCVHGRPFGRPQVLRDSGPGGANLRAFLLFEAAVERRGGSSDPPGEIDMKRLLVLLFALTLLVPALQAQAPAESLSGLWDAAVVVNGLEIPFRFEIAG